MELKKQWNDGGSLSVSYDGDRDGSAVFSSDVAEGLDREMIVVFRDGGRTVAVERKVLQVGMREMFVPSDGEFVPIEGGSFNVLKDVGGNNMSVPYGVSIVTDSGDFIPYLDWDNSGNPIGVCVKDDRIGAIIWDLQLISKQWGTSEETIGVPLAKTLEDAQLLMDGQYYTQCLLNMSDSQNYIAGYANSRRLTIKNNEYIGYVASVGETVVLMEYDNDIQSAFTSIGLDFVNNNAFLNIATSNQSQATTMWFYRFEKDAGFVQIRTASKVARLYVRAVFKYE